MKTPSDNMLLKRKALKLLLEGNINSDAANLCSKDRTLLLTSESEYTDIKTGVVYSREAVEGLLSKYPDAYFLRKQIVIGKPQFEPEDFSDCNFQPFVYPVTLDSDKQAFATELVTIPAVNFESIIFNSIK
jgi:hypothetical protein